MISLSNHKHKLSLYGGKKEVTKASLDNDKDNQFFLETQELLLQFQVKCES